MKKHPCLQEITDFFDSNSPTELWYERTYADSGMKSFERFFRRQHKDITIQFTTGNTYVPSGFNPITHLHHLTSWLIDLRGVLERHYKVKAVSQDAPTSFLGLWVSAKEESEEPTKVDSPCEENTETVRLEQLLTIANSNLEASERQLEDQQNTIDHLRGERQTLEERLEAEKTKYRGLVEKYKLELTDRKNETERVKTLTRACQRHEAAYQELLEENKALHLVTDPIAETSRNFEVENNRLKDYIEGFKKENEALEDAKAQLEARFEQTTRTLKGVLFNFNKAAHLHKKGLEEYQANIRRIRAMVGMAREDTEGEENG